MNVWKVAVMVAVEVRSSCALNTLKMECQTFSQELLFFLFQDVAEAVVVVVVAVANFSYDT